MGRRKRQISTKEYRALKTQALKERQLDPEGAEAQVRALDARMPLDEQADLIEQAMTLEA